LKYFVHLHYSNDTCGQALKEQFNTLKRILRYKESFIDKIDLNEGLKLPECPLWEPYSARTKFTRVKTTILRSI